MNDVKEYTRTDASLLYKDDEFLVFVFVAFLFIYFPPKLMLYDMNDGMDKLVTEFIGGNGSSMDV